MKKNEQINYGPLLLFLCLLIPLVIITAQTISEQMAFSEYLSHQDFQKIRDEMSSYGCTQSRVEDQLECIEILRRDVLTIVESYAPKNEIESLVTASVKETMKSGNRWNLINRN